MHDAIVAGAGVKLRRVLILLAAGILPAAALPQTLRICVDVQSHLPFIDQSGGGITGALLQQAARETGLSLTFYSRPITRCREEIRAGIADAFPTAPFTPALIPFMAFPMTQTEPDPARAVVVARGMVFRRKGSAADWDGVRFSGLRAGVLIPFGSVLLSDRLEAMQVPFDDKGKTLAASFTKLLAGRGDLVIGAEYSGRAQMALPQFQGRIEVLPLPFSEEPYYMGIARTFYDQHQDKVEQLWDAIGRIRRTAAYRASYQKAMQESARDPRE